MHVTSRRHHRLTGGRRDVIGFDVEDGVRTATYVVCNPHKLGHVK